jgi:hypothetical protein
MRSDLQRGVKFCAAKCPAVNRPIERLVMAQLPQRSVQDPSAVVLPNVLPLMDGRLADACRARQTKGKLASMLWDCHVSKPCRTNACRCLNLLAFDKARFHYPATPRTKLPRCFEMSSASVEP